MPATRLEILHAIDILEDRRQPTTADSIARDLGTSRAEVEPEIAAAVRAELLTVATRPNGTEVYALTRAGYTELS